MKYTTSVSLGLPLEPSKPEISVCVMQPSGYIHSMALLEAAEYVTEMCRACGFTARLQKNRLNRHGLNIVFGAHIRPAETPEYPRNTVIFNTEQVPENSVWISTEYKKCLDRHFVWDYSAFNLSELGHNRAERVDFLYHQSMKRIKTTSPAKYDLLFYGSINERRKSIIESLRSRGLTVQSIFGIYGSDRDAIMGNSRAVLNLHYYDAQIFQQIRAFYPLSNGIPVISENYPLESAPRIYQDVLFTPGPRPFIDYVCELMRDKERFDREAAVKIRSFQEQDDTTRFATLLNRTISSMHENALAVETLERIPPTRLNFGSPYRIGYFNVSPKPASLPDAVLDLSIPLEFPFICDSPTWGTVTIAEQQFDEILVIDSLASVSQLTTFMNNALLLLKPGGRLVVTVPYELSTEAWQNPEHVRAFNEHSWAPFTQQFWTLGWQDYRFDCSELSLSLSEYGKSLASQSRPQVEIFRTPRAVDKMHVVLVKVRVAPSERAVAQSHTPGFN